MQNPNLEGKNQNTDEVMGFCRPSVFDPDTHFQDQLFSGYKFIIILVCKKNHMINKKLLVGYFVW